MAQLKNNHETVWRIVKIVLVFAGVLLAIGAFRQQVESNTTQLEKTTKQVGANTNAITRIEIDTTYIKKGVDEIKAEQKTILKELRNK